MSTKSQDSMGVNSKSLGWIILHVTLGGKIIDQDFYIMDCKASYNGILGKDWITIMGAVTIARYSCLKFLQGDKIIKLGSNQWFTYYCNEKSFDGIELSKVKDMHTYEVQAK